MARAASLRVKSRVTLWTRPGARLSRLSLRTVPVTVYQSQLRVNVTRRIAGDPTGSAALAAFQVSIGSD